MSELKPVTPEYVNNIAIDSWRLNSSSRSTPPFTVISLSPRGPEYMVKLPQRSVDQADAMVTSAAVMALSPEQNEPFRDLPRQIMVGLTLRKGFKTEQHKERPCLRRRLCSGVGRNEISVINYEWHFRRTREKVSRSRTVARRVDYRFFSCE